MTLSVLAVSCAKTVGAPSEPSLSEESVRIDPPSVVSGQVVVEFTDEMVEKLEKSFSSGEFLTTRSSAVNEVFSGLEVIGVRRLYPDAGKWEPRHREAGLHKWYVLTYSSANTVNAAIESLTSIEGVAYAEPVRKAKSTAFFSDPKLYQQWHYYNDGSLGKNYSQGCDINVLPVWKSYTAGKSDVIVSIVDGGIDLEHEDLKAACLPGGNNGSKNFVDGSFKIVPHDHGTHVAGTVGAVNNNGIGVSGVAGGNMGNGGVTLMSCQVFKTGPDGKSISADNFGDAMIWGADHGAVISQNSWGYVYENASDAARGGVGGIKVAIDYFIKYAGLDENGNQVGPMKGGVVIFSAGNDNWPDGWPAEYSAREKRCISVGATSSNFYRAIYSNYGDWVTIAAPGGDASVGPQIISTLPGNKYGSMQGTSMAAPHVSGVAALVVSHCGGPGFTNDQLVDKLVNGANPNVLPRNSRIGPMIDAFGAIMYGSSVPPEGVGLYEANAVSNGIECKWAVTSDPDDFKAFGYLILASQNENDFKSIDLKNIPSSVKSASVLVDESAEVGSSITGKIGGLEFETKYYVAIAAFDYNRNFSELSSVKSVVTGINNPPVIVPKYSGDYKFKAFQDIRAEYEISDPDGHDVKVSFNSGFKNPSDAVSLYVDPVTGYNVIEFNGPLAEIPGKYQFKLTATDSYGKSAVLEQDYEFLPNQDPVVVKTPENRLFHSLSDQFTLDASEYIQDPDGEPLSFNAEVTDLKTLHMISTEGSNMIASILDYGLTEVTITGTDAKGKTASTTFKVCAQNPKDPVKCTLASNRKSLSISTGDGEDTYVRVSSPTGKLVYEDTVFVSAFEPLTVDLSNCAPGVYSVYVKFGKTEYSTRILKY